MPIYEYLCEECGHRFELLKASMSTGGDEKCPHCRGLARRQLTTFGISSSGSSGALPCDEGVCPSGPSGCSGGTCPFG